MSELLEKNIRVLSRYRPSLCKIMAAYYSSATAGHSRLVPLEDGFYNLEYSDGQGRKKILFENHSVSRTLAESGDLSTFLYPKIVVMNGFGLGYPLLAFLQNKPGSVKEIIVVEKQIDVFANALKIHDFTEIFSRPEIEFFIGVNPADMKNLLYRYFIVSENRMILADRIENYHFKPALTCDGAYYAAMAEAIKQALRHVAERGHFAPSEDNWWALVNIFNNRESLARYPLLTEFKNEFAGRSAVLVGAGPALAPELDNLKKYRDRLCIMACDAALASLQKNDIDPDFIVTSERVAQITHLYEGLSPDSNAIVLTLPSLHPSVLQKVKRPVIFVKRQATFCNWLWPDQAMSCVPLGVTAVGYKALIELGFSDIYMLGQNLSLDSDSTKTHVEGSVDFLLSTARAQIQYDSIDTLSYTGTPLKTLKFWQIFLGEFEDMIRIHPESRCHHVIAKEKGARIKGAQQMDPGHFWQQLETFPVISGTGDLLRARLARKQGLDLEEKITGLESYLLKLREECLGFMDRLSLDFHDHVDRMPFDEMWDKLEDKLAEWQAWQDKILDLDHALYANFISCLFRGTHITLMSAREAQIPRPESVAKYVMMHVFQSIEWAQQLLSWIERLLHLIATTKEKWDDKKYAGAAL